MAFKTYGRNYVLELFKIKIEYCSVFLSAFISITKSTFGHMASVCDLWMFWQDAQIKYVMILYCWTIAIDSRFKFNMNTVRGWRRDGWQLNSLANDSLYSGKLQKALCQIFGVIFEMRPYTLLWWKKHIFFKLDDHCQFAKFPMYNHQVVQFKPNIFILNNRLHN